ncbi:MAG: ABC transporter ATP-binding protein/permease [Bacilli bacterium]|nr:ABC transporter ATP-binding protein/permease [Bacilli bacterium]
MLKLEKIVKVYDPGITNVVALNGVNIDFRKSEFVSILGPSGCGKTTMLNVIGGLDSYTSGDLIINGKSTKDFKDHDWDNYRNHSIGFVFQSYNLIPHQTVLRNVELALTLSGVDKTTRRKRAIQVLSDVGLSDQINKKPNQLSGGQMQRVAIARALINDPSILLADEPTGALDTVTSEQIMEILKKVSSDRLVIMVTHNSELADKYSSRIIKVLDGVVIDDSNPFSFKKEDDIENEDVDVTGLDEKEAKRKIKEFNKQKRKENKNNSMNFFTALSLSFNNMITKKGRTILTAFAGSIGIIGIALILSLSSGFKGYINDIERNTLSTYPLTVNESNMDTSSILAAFMSETESRTSSKNEYDEDKIYSQNILSTMFSTVMISYRQNDLKKFRDYIEDNKDEFKKLGIIKYSYSTSLKVYSTEYKDGLNQVQPFKFTDHLSEEYKQLKNALSSLDNAYRSFSIWTEMLSNEGDYSLIKSQYDCIKGCFPDEVTDGSEIYSNIVLKLGDYNEIPDYALYALGLVPVSELEEVIGEFYETGQIKKIEPKTFTFDDLMEMEFKVIIPTSLYQLNDDGYYEKVEEEEALRNILDSSLTLKVSGIVKQNVNARAGAITGVIGYTSELLDYIINEINNSAVVKAQKANEDIDILTGAVFSDDKTVQDNYDKFGVVDLTKPTAINFYPSSFENKEKLLNLIDEYNAQFEEESDMVSYTDYVGILISSISTVVSAITYVLIAFVAISLVVSSIMIGIITYISVLERIKEIGILRAIGASKKDVARVFNAETFILGLFSGIIGVLVTILLNIPINIIITALADITGVSKLPFWGATALIIISVGLTMVAGLVPARIASKKDPVIALRTE